MQKQITHIAPFQTAKVVAIYSLVATIPLIVLAALASMIVPGGQKVSPVLFVFAPLFYAIVGFIFTIIGAYVYNIVARFTGGIEFTVTEVRDF
jgi:archaellum biogenesis protein FlaJ (TadC family)